MALRPRDGAAPFGARVRAQAATGALIAAGAQTARDVRGVTDAQVWQARAGLRHQSLAPHQMG
ncbi:hypothetical protein EPIB1_2516 [Tritonibacter mobilis]|nr:hypothetical protein EPIB1_2516 [Tritonibacter mobilis]